MLCIQKLIHVDNYKHSGDTVIWTWIRHSESGRDFTPVVELTQMEHVM